MADIALTASRVEPIDVDKAVIYPFVCGETITKGQAVYLATTGKVGVADANASGKQQAIGIALKGGAANEVIDVMVKGRVAGFTLTSQDYGAPLYLSDTAGALADAAGTMTVGVGRVVPLTDKPTLTKVLLLDFRLNAPWS